MAKILHNGEWYEQLSTKALYEEQYERLLEQHAEVLFPNYVFAKFKMTVSSETSSAKADYALVHRTYKDWWIVEVELGHHSYLGHVLPQVETLATARYDDGTAEYLAKEAPTLNRSRLESMIRGEQPRVLVVVNAAMPEWSRDLKRYGALVTVVEVFRSRYNQHLYRLNGEHPVDDGRVVSQCVVDPLLTRMLRVLSPGILTVQHGETVLIRYGDGLSEWSRLDLQDRVYLTVISPMNLNSKSTYVLKNDESDYLVLEEVK